MTPVGFEPTHPKIVELESTALDRSAKVSIVAHKKSLLHIASKHVRGNATMQESLGEIPQSTVHIVSFADFTTAIL